MESVAIEQDPWPADVSRAPLILSVLVREMQNWDDDERMTLLEEFVETAWPTVFAQSQ
jgi:hypothetical protein